MLNINKVKKKTKNNEPIGIFDSGVGGLSVLIELERLLPNENFVFLADQLHVPYGEKSKNELIKLAYKITDYFINHHNIKMMVAACNTSTCNSISEVRKKYLLPIIGTVPAIKPAARRTKTKTIGIIATPSTSKSRVLKKLIGDHCQNINVFNVGCKNLENMVEKGELESSEVKKLLTKYLKAIKNSNADYLVLGCTHYPFLKNAIRKIVGRNIKLINSGRAIAKQTRAFLNKHSLKNSQRKRGESLYFSTGDHIKFTRVASKLLKHQIKAQKVKL